MFDLRIGRRRAAWLTLVAALILVVTIARAAAVEQTPAAPTPGPSMRLTSTGVYTDAQAARGEALYADTCQRCHGKSLEGDPSKNAGSLAGADFLKARTGQDLGRLYRYLIERMPDDDPGTLTPQTAADVIAYILKFNAFPSGKDELPADAGRLKLVVIGTSDHRKSGSRALR